MIESLYDDVVVGPLPAELLSLESLLGSWRGTGRGGFPTIGPFEYGERIDIEHVGDGFLLSSQRSWLAGDGSPLHFERGFWRPGEAAGSVEVTLAHPLGLTEVSEGTVLESDEGVEIHLQSEHIGRTTTGMAVRSLARRYVVRGDVLSYELDMETATTPSTLHLTAELRRRRD
jgi:THAP4-like, heme-binding beta-barrel domain